jgi:hypothetical protein
VVLTTKKDTPPTPKNSTANPKNMNNAATPRFFAGSQRPPRAVVNIRPSTDSAAKDIKSKPMRNQQSAASAVLHVANPGMSAYLHTRLCGSVNCC